MNVLQEEHNPAFGDRLKQVRSEFGETVRDFSERLGVARQTIYEWYKLEDPTQKALGALVSSYPTVSVEWLKTGKGEMIVKASTGEGKIELW